MTTHAFAPGFADPVTQSQAVFRSVLAAMAEPGSANACAGLQDAPLPPVMAAVALALLDYETPFWLTGFGDGADIAAYLGFHTGARLAAISDKAAFIFAGAEAVNDPPAGNIGDPAYPDRSGTVILQSGTFGAGPAVAELSGPGLRTPATFSASNLGRNFWAAAVENAALYPLGVDFIICGDNRVAALPRSTRIRIIGN